MAARAIEPTFNTKAWQTTACAFALAAWSHYLLLYTVIKWKRCISLIQKSQDIQSSKMLAGKEFLAQFTFLVTWQRKKKDELANRWIGKKGKKSWHENVAKKSTPGMKMWAWKQPGNNALVKKWGQKWKQRSTVEPLGLRHGGAIIVCGTPRPTASGAITSLMHLTFSFRGSWDCEPALFTIVLVLIKLCLLQATVVFRAISPSRLLMTCDVTSFLDAKQCGEFINVCTDLTMTWGR